MLRNTVVLAALLAFCASSSFAQNRDAQGGAQALEGPADRAHTEHDLKDKEPLTPEKFLNKLHHINQKEVKMGRLAQEKGQSDSIKEYGQRLVQDHQKADQQVTQLAQQQSIEIMKMPEPDSAKASTTPGAEAPGSEQARAGEKQDKAKKEREHMEHLRSLSGEEFDRAFAQMMVKDHSKTLELLNRAEQQPGLDEVKPIITQLRPTIEQHKQQAQQMAQEVGADTSAAATGQS